MNGVHNKLATLLFGSRLVNLYYVGKRQAFSLHTGVFFDTDS